MSTAATLNRTGITDIQTSAQASHALRPLAGDLAFALFALGIIALATLAGVALDFTPIDPIKGLFWSAVVNGVIAVPIMIVMMLMADGTSVMGPFTVTRRLKMLGWPATWTMAAAVVAMLISE